MKQNLLANIRIVLVEPAGALNVGSIARIMKNMGLTNLVLVNPRCDRSSDEARQMAVHAVDVLETAQIVESIPTALAGCQQAIATTVRSRSVPIVLESPATVLPELLVPNIQSALLFGAEDRGLSNDELKYAQRFICIESNPDYPSLNLAQAVAICVYQLYQFYRNNKHRS
jgi:tRNA/rRNA methyltransferase